MTEDEDRLTARIWPRAWSRQWTLAIRPAVRSCRRAPASSSAQLRSSARDSNCGMLRAESGQPVAGSSEGHESTYADIELRINGETRAIRVPHQRTLLLALREDLGLTGTKKSCNLGQCGACTVLMDGLPIYSCMLLALDAAGHDVTTIEGVGEQGALHPVQEGFVRHMGSQCGHCTPGMVMSGVALMQQNPQPTPDDVRQALSGNLCRCGNYRNEIAAILSAAGCAGGSRRRRV